MREMKEGVVEDDALPFPETKKVRVAMTAALRAINLIELC